MDFSGVARQLGQNGLGIWPGFLAPAVLLQIRNDLKLLQTAAGFHAAGTGQGKGHDVRARVRNDQVHWVDREDSTPAQTLLWTYLDALGQAFNRILFLGLSDCSGHYAAYPAGGFYRRHRDRFSHAEGDGEGRVVSVIIYLNPDWVAPDGGQLRVYGSTSHTDIEPVGGTLVCFFSDESEHEVLPSHAPRISFAGWYSRKRIGEMPRG